MPNLPAPPRRRLLGAAALVLAAAALIVAILSFQTSRTALEAAKAAAIVPTPAPPRGEPLAPKPAAAAPSARTPAPPAVAEPAPPARARRSGMGVIDDEAARPLGAGGAELEQNLAR